MATSPIPDSASVVVSRELLATDFGGELVLLNLRDGVYYSLEDVGIRIWQLLQDPVTVAVIRDALVSEYDVDPARCERDIQTFLGELAGKGLVEIRERP
jgi:hypothetical protein